MLKRVLSLSALFLFAGLMPAHATRLDISADSDFKFNYYGNGIYGEDLYNSSFVSEKTKLGFYVSDIELENLPDSSMDIGISLQSIAGLSADKLSELPALAQPQESYPSENITPYIREAYINIRNILSPKLSAVIGRQDFSLGQGLALGSDNMGFTGLLFQADDLFWGYGAEIFYFNPSRYDVSFATSSAGVKISKSERKYHVYGAALNNNTEEGKWQIYHFYQHYGDPSEYSMGGNSVSETRSFSGIRYAMRKKHISFDGEVSVQGGNADLYSGGKADFSGYAFMMKGSWEQGIYIFDNVKLRLAYGRSSSSSYDEGGTASTDKDSSFYAALGSRYNGFSRSGYGAIAGASVYDINPSSKTANGMPDGVSALSVVNIGADIPFKNIVFSADYYKFKADYINAVSRITVADEVDLRLLCPLGKSLSLELLYAYFSPGEMIFGENAKKTSFASFGVNARF